ncbi:MAG: redoxin domain-containing protein [Clostridia bacterium]
MSRVRQDYDKIKKTDTEVVTISVDNPEETKKFKEKLDLPFIMLSDKNLDVIKEYNTLDEKEREDGPISLVATFIISKEKLHFKYISQDHWEDVPSNKSIIEILEKMEDNN